MNGYLRVASIMPNVFVGNPLKNLNSIKDEILKANTLSVKFCVLPELCITGNNLQSLYFDRNILNDAKAALFSLLTFSSELDMVIIVSLPFELNDNIYEVASIIKSGNILGFVPKNVFKFNNDNKDYFSKLNQNIENITLYDNERNILYSFPFSNDLLFSNDKFKFSIAFDNVINKNLKSDLVANITSIPETINIDSCIKDIKNISKNEHCIIVTSTPGPSESTEHYSYFGRSTICENGDIIAKNDIITNHILVSDVDLDINVFNSSNNFEYKPFKEVAFSFSNFISNPVTEKLFRDFDKTPYIIKSIKPYSFCMHIINILSIALAKRMNSLECNNLVIGVSGGLDSTIALLICKKTIEFLSLSNSNIHAYSMPGYGTTQLANNNIANLLKSLDVKLNTIDITNSLNIHFNDINHDISIANVTFENAQARERTQILMDIANDINGIVVGTGDLSEIALGFSTYNGDQMSMYNINASLPKTLIKYILNTIAEENINTKNNILLADTLKNILHSPISPELLPTENGILIQKTEEILGNYEIHDFILYYYLKYNFDAKKIFDLAIRTFVYNNNEHNYNEEYIKNCINIFFNRFYKAQFKRTCSPASPDIGLPNLNSHYSFKMPSDANINIKI